MILFDFIDFQKKKIFFSKIKLLLNAPYDAKKWELLWVDRVEKIFFFFFWKIFFFTFFNFSKFPRILSHLLNHQSRLPADILVHLLYLSNQAIFVSSISFWVTLIGWFISILYNLIKFNYMKYFHLLPYFGEYILFGYLLLDSLSYTK